MNTANYDEYEKAKSEWRICPGEVSCVLTCCWNTGKACNFNRKER